jgi:hypothetical protein
MGLLYLMFYFIFYTHNGDTIPQYNGTLSPGGKSAVKAVVSQTLSFRLEELAQPLTV